MRLSLGQPLSKNTRHSLAYKVEQFDVYNVADTASDAIKDEAGKRLSSGLEYTLSYDSRNRYFGATRGLRPRYRPISAGVSLVVKRIFMDFKSKVRIMRH